MPASQTVKAGERTGAGDSENVGRRSIERGFFWAQAVALLGAILLAAGAAIAYFKPGLLLSPHEQVTEGVRIYAGYLTSRNAALALALLVALFLRARSALGSILLIVGAIQIFDACMDAAEARWALVPGISMLGILFLLAAVSIRRRQTRRTADLD